MIGKEITHYKILEKIGQGGMGVVYKAEDLDLKRPVAIKFLQHEIASRQQLRDRFKIEARAAAALNHPSIATIHAIEEIDGEIFIVMEYICGQGLQDILSPHRDIPLAIEKVTGFTIQLAEGLQEAHRNGVVHRDIKSANIMLNDKGQMKILDFGLAKLIGSTQQMQDGDASGTIHYMSPEQANAKDISHHTDIWSLGVVLYEMITGQLPFKGQYQQEIFYSICHEEPQSVSELRTEVPIELVKIVERTLQKDKADRYQRMGDLLVDLKIVSSQLLQKSWRVKVASSQAESVNNIEPEEIIDSWFRVSAFGVSATTSSDPWAT